MDNTSIEIITTTYLTYNSDIGVNNLKNFDIGNLISVKVLGNI